MINRPDPSAWLRRYTVQPNGCWLWSGACTAGGYGEFVTNGVPKYAHRAFYEHHIGPIPSGLHIDHLCRNRACVNPTHLEPVTCRENLRRGDTFVAKNTAKTHCHKGHPLSAENTYTYQGPYGPKRQCMQCNRERMNKYRRADGIPSRPPRGPYSKRTKK